MNVSHTISLLVVFVGVSASDGAWAGSPAEALNTLWTECLTTAVDTVDTDLLEGSGTTFTPLGTDLLEESGAAIAVPGTEPLDGSGPISDAADAATETVDMLLPILIESSGTPCEGMRDADACTQWIAAQTCDSLASALLPSVEASLSELDAELASLFNNEELPLWAQTVSHALGTIVTDCYAAETGTTMTDESLASLQYWEQTLAAGLVSITRGQPIEQRLVADCVQYLHDTGCELMNALQPGSASMPTLAEGPCSDMLLWDRTFGE